MRSGKLKSTLERLYSRGMLHRFVLDEAHCISAWGHDFRKDYTELRGLKHLFPTTPIMCLTATATRRVQDDIVRQLNLPKCLRFFDTFNRINLTYEVHPKLKAKQMILKIKDLIVERGLMRNGKVQCGIIYCFSQNDCERVANELNKIDRAAGDHKRFGVGRKRALRAVPYHAGLTDKVRRENQEAWQSDRAQIICATVAFGMGINKPNVRFVFHHSMPKSLEAYHQESGRAGRDGAHEPPPRGALPRGRLEQRRLALLRRVPALDVRRVAAGGGASSDRGSDHRFAQEKASRAEHRASDYLEKRVHQ